MEVLKIRAPWAQLRTQGGALLVVLTALVALTVFWRHASEPPSRLTAVVVGGWVGGGLAAAWFLAVWLASTTCAPEGLRTTTLFGPVTIPWASVSSISYGPVRRGDRVVVRLDNGSRLRLIVPCSYEPFSRNPAFARQLRQLQVYWEAVSAAEQSG